MYTTMERGDGKHVTCDVALIFECRQNGRIAIYGIVCFTYLFLLEFVVRV